MSPRGEAYKRYRMGPRTEPWGTPHKRECLSDSDTSIWRNWESVKYDVNQSSALPLIPNFQVPVVQKVDNVIHRINHYPVDSVLCFLNAYPLDSDLSRRWIALSSLWTDRGQKRQRNQIWQAKHDKSGLSWKSPIESKWSMCEIEKSLCEIGKSLREITKSLYEKLKLLYENEKMSCEIIITNREWKTAMWDLY